MAAHGCGLHCRLISALPLVLTFSAAFVPSPARAQEASMKPFTDHGDVGAPAQAGRARFDAATQTFTLTGAGVNMWEKKDEFQFVWRKMKGDFQITSEIAFAPALPKSIAHRKLGVMIRQDLDADSAYADIAVHGDGLTSLQIREKKGEITTQLPASIVAADVIQLARKGKKYTMRVTHKGEPLGEGKSINLDLGDEVYVGIYICSHDAAIVETGMFRNVRITVPAPDSLVQYRDYLESDLEILDIETGRREVIFHAPDSIQAPNWTVDGKSLIYNSNGKLYLFDLATRRPKELNTGAVQNNNNDHALSFDGKWLGISSSAEDDQGRSNIYVVPVEGGEPRRVTKRGHSYFHGWSPDGKLLTYTAERGDGTYNIYTIPAAGGDETRITTTDGLDDGPEFNRDGSRIYFNSTRTGRMQIWRMYPSGGDQEQVTDTNLNNWFPHISPDSKSIVFISFELDVPADLHPFYKQVYIQLMPYPGGTPKVIAYLYGGQGTINVPSWSPDSKKIALVSNSGDY